jgi:hypothetical protein
MSMRPLVSVGVGVDPRTGLEAVTKIETPASTQNRTGSQSFY